MDNKEKTGYPSIDKPWLKYYTQEQIKETIPPCRIYDYLWMENKDYLDDIALNYYDREITYGQVFDNIEQTAKAFLGIGITEGDIVPVISVTIPETIYALYALNRIGAVANMIDPRTSVQGIREYILEVDAKFVIVIDAVCKKIMEAVDNTSVGQVIIMSPSDSLPLVKKLLFKLTKRGDVGNEEKIITWSDFLSYGKDREVIDAKFRSSNCAVIVHTGGTTGMPKGVMLSNENFNEMVFSFANNGLSFDRGKVLLSIMPPFIAYGIVNGIHVVLCRGMQIVLVPQFDPEQMDNLVLKYRPSHMLATPTHYDTLLYSKKIKENMDLSFIDVAGIGGDGLSEKNETRLKAFFSEHNCRHAVLKGYGMTEVSAAACATRPEQNALGSVGLPFVKVIISAFKQGTDKELKYGETGELCIFSPSTMVGYYGNLEETQKILRTHSDGRKWIHTGDLGYVDEDGNVFVIGRMKRMIVRFDGFKVFPTMIETVIRQCDDIKDCCAVGTDDVIHSQGQLPVVFAVLKFDMKKQVGEVLDELKGLCEAELPEYAQPAEIRFIPDMPVTSIGKVDYRKLEEMANGKGV